MLLNPKYPPAPTTPAAPVITSAVPPQHAHAPVCACQQGHPIPGRQVAPTFGVAAGAVAAVVTVGVVLTALLVAVTVAAVSVAVVAVVLRSLLAPPRRR
jgi:hypothetical protein